MRRELTETDLMHMNLPKRFWGATIERVTTQGKPCAQAIVYSYLEQVDELLDRGVGLLLWGDNGRGKTSIMSLIGKEAKRRGRSVFFYESAALKADTINKTMFSDTTSVIDRARECDVLLLDDLGKGVQDSTGFGARLLDELVRYRYARQKVTCITTNMTPSALRDELKMSTLHTMKECLLPLKVEGIDHREAEAAEIMNLLTKGR